MGWIRVKQFRVGLISGQSWIGLVNYNWHFYKLCMKQEKEFTHIKQRDMLLCTLFSGRWGNKSHFGKSLNWGLRGILWVWSLYLSIDCRWSSSLGNDNYRWGCVREGQDSRVIHQNWQFSSLEDEDYGTIVYKCHYFVKYHFSNKFPICIVVCFLACNFVMKKIVRQYMRWCSCVWYQI